MICLQCDNEEFLPKQDAVIEQEFRGEAFRIQMPALACAKCGWIAVDLQQADELRKRTADAYRKKHGLLTSDEIKAFRKLLRKTQREFAAFLGVGEASVKRWETWLPQEKGNDNLIRMKCEKALLDHLAQKSSTAMWTISWEVDPTEVVHGVASLAGPPHAGSSSRWDYAPQPGPACELQMEFSDVAHSEIAGPSPPERCADGAFSSSMSSPEGARTEDVEEENATKLEQSERALQVDDYGHPATLAIAA
jgi:putative zinc finger/helix-turn-helix YgiT family protein